MNCGVGILSVLLTNVAAPVPVVVRVIFSCVSNGFIDITLGVSSCIPYPAVIA